MRNTNTIWTWQEKVARRLLLWSGLSMAAGGLLWWRGSPFWRGFGAQAVGWGAIDALIALFGRRAARRRHARLGPAASTEAVTARETQNLLRLLWLNTGLDLLYMAGGVALARTKGRHSPEWRGHGWGIVLQGMFLFFFDLYHAQAIRKENVR